MHGSKFEKSLPPLYSSFFQILLRATGCLKISDANDEILYKASLKSSELASGADVASADSSRELSPLAKVLLMFAVCGYTFNTRSLNAARVEGDPFDRAPGERLSAPRDADVRNGATAALRSGDSIFPFPSLYRSLVFLQYDNPRTLKELTCLSIRSVFSVVQALSILS